MFENISPQEKINFTKNLALMLRSGIAINEALGILADDRNGHAFKKVVARVQKNIERGMAVSEAFQKEKEVFDTVYVSLLRMGESSGTLPEAFDFLAGWLERTNDLRREVRQAMLYPRFILSATGLLAAALSIFILPRLVTLFQSLHVKLPLTTVILLRIATFIRDRWEVLVIGFVIFLIAYKLAKRIRQVRYWLDYVSLKVPFLGSIVIDYQIAMITHVFATVFQSGMSLTDAMNVMRVASTNAVYQHAIEKISRRVQTGDSLSLAFSHHENLFSKSVIVIIGIGERTGKLGDSMRYISDFYTKQLNTKTKKLPVILEPVLLIIVGCAVGFVAISIITPIYELTRGL